MIPIIKRALLPVAFCVGACVAFSCDDARNPNEVLSQVQYVELLRTEGFLAQHDTVRMFTPEQFADCVRAEGLAGPDSLMTPEMRRRAEVLFDVLYERSIVRDNWLLLTCDRQYVIEQEVPAIYYDLLVYNCWSMSESLNRWIAEGRMTVEEGDLQRLFEEAKQTRPFGREADAEARKTTAPR